MAPTGTPDYMTLLQMLAASQGQQNQPDQQMSQQGQFNPAAMQAGGPSIFTQPPAGAGMGRQILNALGNAGKAATYVAEDPRERMGEDARAQQLWETKQKMLLASQEFGQREKDRTVQQQQLDAFRSAGLAEKKAGREATTDTKNADRKARLLQAGMDENGDPLPADKLPPGLRSKIELNDASEQLKQSQAALADARVKNLPEQLQNAQKAHQVALANYQLKLAQFERDTFGQVPSAMTPGAAAGPGAQPMTTPQGTLTTDSGAPTGWKNPSAPTSATKTKAQQADAIVAVGKKLLPEIDKVADKLGPWSGRGQSFDQWWGSISPAVQSMATLKESFNALQPALHQFRGSNVMQELSKKMGTSGFKTNAEALKASVQAMIDSAQTMRGAWMKQPDQQTAPTGGLKITRDASGRITGIE